MAIELCVLSAPVSDGSPREAPKKDLQELILFGDPPLPEIPSPKPWTGGAKGWSGRVNVGGKKFVVRAPPPVEINTKNFWSDLCGPPLWSGFVVRPLGTPQSRLWSDVCGPSFGRFLATSCTGQVSESHGFLLGCVAESSMQHA